MPGQPYEQHPPGYGYPNGYIPISADRSMQQGSHPPWMWNQQQQQQQTAAGPPPPPPQVPVPMPSSHVMYQQNGPPPMAPAHHTQPLQVGPGAAPPYGPPIGAYQYSTYAAGPFAPQTSQQRQSQLRQYQGPHPQQAPQQMSHPQPRPQPQHAPQHAPQPLPPPQMLPVPQHQVHQVHQPPPHEMHHMAAAAPALQTISESPKPEHRPMVPSATPYSPESDVSSSESPPGSGHKHPAALYERELKKKTRKRLSISCRTCRKKKIKCDRERPICGSCAKNNIPAHLCIYEGSPWATSLVEEQNLISKIEFLKDQQKKLLAVLEEEGSKAQRLREKYDVEPKVSVGSQATGDRDDADADAPSPAERLKNAKIYLSRYCSTVDTRESCKTFGPMTWQNILLQSDVVAKLTESLVRPEWEMFLKANAKQLKLKEALSRELFEYRPTFPLSSIGHKKPDPLAPPSKNDAFGRKIQNLAALLPSYRYLEAKLHFFIDLRGSVFIEPFIDNLTLLADFKRIFKKTRKGGVDINVYDRYRDHSTELNKLAILLIVFKFGIVFDESDDPFVDSYNMFVGFATSCLYNGNIFTEPSMSSIEATLLLAYFKLVNPDDLADQIFPQKAASDLSLLMNVCFNMMMVLGLWRPYEEIVDFSKDPRDPNDNFITAHRLKSLWKNLLYVENAAAKDDGMSFSSRHLYNYGLIAQQIEPGDFQVQQMLLERETYQKYGLLNGYNDSSICKVFDNLFDFSQQQKRMTRLDVEKSLLQVTEFAEVALEVSNSTPWKGFAGSMSALSNNKFLSMLSLLDMTMTLNHMLYVAYTDPKSVLNVVGGDASPAGAALSDDETAANTALAYEYLSATILHVVFTLKVVDWFIWQEVGSEELRRDTAFRILAWPRIKKSMMKALAVIISLLVHSTGEERVKNLQAHDFSLLSLEMVELEQLCFRADVKHEGGHAYCSDALLTDLSALLEKMYINLRRNHVIGQDPKWFWAYQQYYYIALYLLVTKRNFVGRMTELFNLEEFVGFQRIMELEAERNSNGRATTVGSVALTNVTAELQQRTKGSV